MIARAIERGVSSVEIADALDLQVQSVLRRFRLLAGISPEAAEMLKDTPCSMKVFGILRHARRPVVENGAPTAKRSE
ncbi:plasmid partitioning protein RepB C-terminal domain-containing protein [Aminobacter sp. SR38]|jgi:hypothetical protein|uniref:plasmid partitioning protein RepB C-terminal domain-containing protein n=1 Tax=Aminobacter sp. SR38 TaxID=2774562 RepID=UPI001FF0182B|nr:plasmid partitioning protein RepB C-terminal domain-containing protein [Aminobacter sp. SR38]